MKLGSIINVLLVSFWIMSQTVMAFAHVPFAGSGMKSSHTEISSVSTEHDGKNAFHSHTTMADDGVPGSNTHHSGLGIDDCGSAECSVGSLFGPSHQHGLRVSRSFDMKPANILSPVDLGLPTPPPNTTV